MWDQVSQHCIFLKSTLEISNANVYQALVDRDPTEMALELVSGFGCLPALTIGWQIPSPRALDVFRFGLTMGFASLKLELT